MTKSTRLLSIMLLAVLIVPLFAISALAALNDYTNPAISFTYENLMDIGETLTVFPTQTYKIRIVDETGLSTFITSDREFYVNKTENTMNNIARNLDASANVNIWSYHSENVKFYLGAAKQTSANIKKTYVIAGANFDLKDDNGN